MAPAETGKPLLRDPRMVLEQRGTQGYSAARVQASPNQGLTPNLQPDYPQKMQGINAHGDVGKIVEARRKNAGTAACGRQGTPGQARPTRSLDAMSRASRSPRSRRECAVIPLGVLSSGDTKPRRALARQGQSANKSMRGNAPSPNIRTALKDVWARGTSRSARSSPRQFTWSVALATPACPI
jgi:hypothetical protein